MLNTKYVFLFSILRLSEKLLFLKRTERDTIKTVCWFDVQVTVHLDKFLYQNQLDALISQIYFWNKTLHVSDSSSVHH
jgi:hypothetical protein